jgi:hypothetical protein
MKKTSLQAGTIRAAAVSDEIRCRIKGFAPVSDAFRKLRRSEIFIAIGI